MAIKYKGFEIRKVYHICADWKLDKNGTVIARKPKPEDISHYCIFDTIENKDWIKENTIAECKVTIDDFLKRNNLNKNT